MRSVGPATVLDGRHILVCEDEYLIASDLAETLERLGATIAGPAGSVGQALRLVAGTPPLAAGILDVNLHDEPVYPVADALTAGGVPFLFTTGYEALGIPDRYRGVVRLEKPIDKARLVRVLSGFPRRSAA